MDWREDDGLDGQVHALDRTREDVLPEERLVLVDTDSPDLLLLGGVECAEAAAAGDREDDGRTGGDLVDRQLLALRLVDEVLREVESVFVPGTHFFAPCPVGGDEDR